MWCSSARSCEREIVLVVGLGASLRKEGLRERHPWRLQLVLQCDEAEANQEMWRTTGCDVADASRIALAR